MRCSSAPIALNSGQNSGSAFCVLCGAHRPFDGAPLKALYPSQGVYFGAVLRAVLDDPENRCVVLAAASETLVAAGLSGVPPG